jgi:hypothetical protein
MSSKRQQTFAKMERERRVKERRALKQEKKQAAAAERRGDAVEAPGHIGEQGEAPVSSEQDSLDKDS